MENHELTPGPRCSVNIEQSKAVSHGERQPKVRGGGKIQATQQF